MIRRFESASGSLVGVTGALYAARRLAIKDVPAGVILDDMWIPLAIAEAGYRIVFEPQAIARDRASGDPATEEIRKRRTLMGNYQLLHRWPRLAIPGGHPLAWRLWGHKWLRLLAPWLLLMALASNVALALTGNYFYLALLALQLGSYALAVLARRHPARRRVLAAGAHGRRLFQPQPECVAGADRLPAQPERAPVANHPLQRAQPMIQPPALKRVVYVVSLFPSLSETFIVREINTLIERGVDVRIISLKKPSKDLLQTRAAALLDRVRHPQACGRALRDVAHAFRLSPRAVLRRAGD